MLTIRINLGLRLFLFQMMSPQKMQSGKYGDGGELVEELGEVVRVTLYVVPGLSVGSSKTAAWPLPSRHSILVEHAAAAAAAAATADYCHAGV